MAKVQFDTVALTDIINDCFLLSMDGRLSIDQQTEMLTLGKRLRGTLINIISAIFDDQTEDFQKATADLKKVNNDLKAQIQQLTNLAQTVKEIGALIGDLDKLLSVATAFV